MNISKRYEDEIVIVTPEKNSESNESEHLTIDIANNKTLVDAIEDELQKGKFKIIINLKHIAFVDSSGLQGLFTCAININKRNGSLLITDINNNILRIFKITSLLDIVKPFGTEADAIKSLIS